MLNRRSLITGLISLVAAPAIVRAQSLMPVKAASDEIIALRVAPFTTDGIHPNLRSLVGYAGKVVEYIPNADRFVHLPIAINAGEEFFVRTASDSLTSMRIFLATAPKPQ